MTWMLMPLRRYRDLTWRSRRRIYRLFVLLYAVIFMVASAIDHRLGYGSPRAGVASWEASAMVPDAEPFRGVVALPFLLPSLAAGVRRLHDTDRSGWWMLTVLIPYLGTGIPLVFFCLNGVRGSNRYGSDPKRPQATAIRFA